LAGFVVGFLSSFSLGFLGLDGTGWVAVALGALGAVGGGAIGLALRSPSDRARTTARWSAATALAVGIVAFLAGFVGPMVVRPDSPQGPLLGILFTGPLGALAGALIGALIGLLVSSSLKYKRF
jgi:hypothetical protein